jgi:serine/threonine protein kinase
MATCTARAGAHRGADGGELPASPVRRPARLADAGPVSWTRGELIGAGAFGRVYLGLNNDTGQLMAVKQARAAMARNGTSSAAVSAAGGGWVLLPWPRFGNMECST